MTQNRQNWIILKKHFGLFEIGKNGSFWDAFCLFGKGKIGSFWNVFFFTQNRENCTLLVEFLVYSEYAELQNFEKVLVYLE